MLEMILIQAIGFVGVLFNFIAFQFNEHWKITLFISLGNLMFVIHFLLLGAYTGAILGVIGIIRNFLYMFLIKHNKSTLLWSILFAVIVIVAGIITWTSILSLLAIIANILAVIIYGIKNAHVIRLLNFPASGCWMAYNICYFSLAGIINETFTLISLIMGEIRWKKSNI